MTPNLPLLAALHTALTGQEVAGESHFYDFAIAGQRAGFSSRMRLWPFWLDERHVEHPVPDYLSWEGFGALVEAAHERKWCVATSFDPSGFSVTIHKTWATEVLGGAFSKGSMMDAFARAMLEALGGEVKA